MQRKPIQKAAACCSQARTTEIAYLCGDGNEPVPWCRCLRRAVGSRSIRVWPNPRALISEYADAPGSEEKHSKREEQTLGPLAEKLGIKPNFGFGKGQENEAVAAARQATGPVLIAWEHKNLFKLASAITTDPLPDNWPKERYDVVLLFRLLPDGTKYSCEQIPQLLLAGDEDTAIT